MRSLTEIRQLLDDLESRTADGLENQDLDFKEWDARSMKHSVNQVIEMAICMANGGTDRSIPTCTAFSLRRVIPNATGGSTGKLRKPACLAFSWRERVGGNRV